VQEWATLNALQSEIIEERMMTMIETLQRYNESSCTISFGADKRTFRSRLFPRVLWTRNSVVFLARIGVWPTNLLPSNLLATISNEFQNLKRISQANVVLSCQTMIHTLANSLYWKQTSSSFPVSPCKYLNPLS
jgi:hypothetical protein